MGTLQAFFENIPTVVKVAASLMALSGGLIALSTAQATDESLNRELTDAEKNEGKVSFKIKKDSRLSKLGL